MKPVFLVLLGLLVLSACSTTPNATSPTSLQTPTSTTQSPAQKEASRTVLNQAIEAYQAKAYQTALPLFLQADSMGNFKAARYLGLMALQGQGVPQDNLKAYQYFSQASQNGDITAKYWLGYCYENGIGTAQNYEQARFWYADSAQRGDIISAPAMIALGNLYEQGKGVKQDLDEAKRYYTLAMNAGDPNAKAHLQRLQTVFN